MNYFQNCTTIDEAKKLYYELAKQLHPDKNPGKNTTKLFQDLQNQFEKFKPNPDKLKYKNEMEDHRPAEYIFVINELIKLAHKAPGIRVSVNGSFIWISGDTKPIKDDIKTIIDREKYPNFSLRCGFAKTKQQWYFSPTGYRKLSRRTLEFDEIQSLYGHEEIERELKGFNKIAS